MHDELVKRLRIAAQLADKGLVIMPSICLEAADAIAQLSNAGSAYGRGWTLGYDAGREESKPRWIPVTERLPKYGERILVFGGVTMYVAYYDKNRYGGESWHKLNSKSHYCNPTHWMPLPQPPKELTGTDMRGGIRWDEAGNVIDWGITGPPGDVGKTEEGE